MSGGRAARRSPGTRTGACCWSRWYWRRWASWPMPLPRAAMGGWAMHHRPSWRTSRPSKTTGKLAGRVALITGGSRGIGAAIAKAFAREGAQIAFTFHSRADAAREVVAEIERGGGEALAIRAEAADADEARRAVEQTVERYGRINILVNNAGAIGREVTVRDMPVEEWDRLIGTDLRGVF